MNFNLNQLLFVVVVVVVVVVVYFISVRDNLFREMVPGEGL